VQAQRPVAHSGQAQQAAVRIPLAAGLTLVSTLQGAARKSGASDDAAWQGDREDVIVVDQVGTDGVRYRWSYTGGSEPRRQGDRGSFTRFVRAEDLAAAPRVNLVFASSDPERVPGATAFSLSRAALAELRGAGRTRLSYAEVDDGVGGLLGARGIGLGLGGSRVYYRGALTLVSPEPVALPLLIDGRRTAVSALHARGRFSLGERRIELDFFVVPDPEHPLLLKITGQGGTWQVLRVGLPGADAGALIERSLERECRAELPGVYFAFGAAEVSAESAEALRAVAALLGRHPAWRLAVEGHTDSIGSAPANTALSARRAEAVRTRLVTAYGVPAARLSARGLGQTRPRESNATLAGRARNRRVELARSCTPAR
jgi:outer membrane protein OmpA-like peptidoglycan-associated protein